MIKITDTCAGDTFEFETTDELYMSFRNSCSDEDRPKWMEICHYINEAMLGYCSIPTMNLHAGKYDFYVEF